MEIQKGLVKYKDRSDIVCTYGIVDGVQYYFLDQKPLSNGNLIATKTLVEAIDVSVIASTIGVLDPNGKVVIPFENKAIKLMSNDLLLVEKAHPTTESVLEAIKLRSDPLAATKLVTTPAAIKDKMNAKMGSEGRFIFNDQFSEASVFDVNGNNIIDGEYYSFIGINKEKLFFSKNVADSEVREFVIPQNKEEVSEEAKIDINVEKEDSTVPDVPEEKKDEKELDITAAVVNKDSIEGVIQKEEKESSPSDVPVIEEKAEDTTNEVIVLPPDTDMVAENADKKVELKEEGKEESSLPEHSVEQPEEKTEEPFSLKIEIPETKEEEKQEEVKEQPAENPFDSFRSEKVVSDMEKEDDIFSDSVLKEDKIDTSSFDDDSDYFNHYETSSSFSETDTTMEQVASTMSHLIELNRKQKDTIANYQDEISKLKSSRREITNKAKEEVNRLRNNVSDYQAQIEKLRSQNERLNRKISEQGEIISHQTKELEGKKQLMSLLEDAQNLLVEDPVSNGYSKVA